MKRSGDEADEGHRPLAEAIQLLRRRFHFCLLPAIHWTDGQFGALAPSGAPADVISVCNWFLLACFAGLICSAVWLRSPQGARWTAVGLTAARPVRAHPHWLPYELDALRHQEMR